MSKCKTSKETAANNLGVHLTELHKIIRWLQAEFVQSRKETCDACVSPRGSDCKKCPF